MVERHEIEDLRREKEEQEKVEKWNAFFPEAVARIKECLENDGDLVDEINTLDLEYDDVDNLENKDINETVINAVRGMK